MKLDWLKQADWLGLDRARGYMCTIAVLQLAALVLLVGTAHGGVDRNGFLLGTDFLSFWTAAKMLWSGGNPYDIAAHIAEQRGHFASQEGYVAFFYPPPFLLVCWPLASLGYFAALCSWLALTGTAFAVAVRAWLGRLPWWAFAGFPPVLITIAHGQTSFLVAALLGGATVLTAQSRPVAGGILFGLAVIKPQFGVLVPLALLASGQWRAVMAATSTAVVAGLTATAAFGLQIWPDWWRITTQAQDAMSAGAVGYAKMISLFAGLRLLGAPIGAAYAAQLVLSLAVALAVALVVRRRGFTIEAGAVMLCGALLATPFVLDYDLVLTAFPLVLLAMRGADLPWERITMLGAVIMPSIARSVALIGNVPLAPPVLCLLFALLVRRAWVGGPNSKGATIAAPRLGNGGRSKD